MLKKAVTVLISLVVVCGILEMVLRTTHLFNARVSWTEPDRDIGWRFTPGREYWFFGENDHPITGRINSTGWRDKERTVETPASTYRIAVLGDSYVEAFQVELDSTFCAIGERALNAVHPPQFDHVEVMIFGRSGMSPSDESFVLTRDVLPCQPDAVILLFTPHNDIADVNPATAADTERPFVDLERSGDNVVMDRSFTRRRGFRIRTAINPLKQHSALVSLMAERYNVARLARAQRRTEAPARLTRAQSLCTAHPDSVFAKNYALCQALIESMAFECKSKGIRFVLASVPLVYEEAAFNRARTLDVSFEPVYFDRTLGALAESDGFAYVPMTAEFAFRSLKGVPLQWQHWSYQGHRAAAEILLNPGSTSGAPADSNATH